MVKLKPRPSGSSLVLGSPYSDNLVLQRNRCNVIWGWDTPHQRIVLKVSGVDGVVEATSLADNTGCWQLICPKLPEGGPYTLMIDGSSQITLNNVLVGEVWLASGQSNMEWRLSAINDAEATIARAHTPRIRLFTVEHTASDGVNPTVEGTWVECSPDTAESFSAVGYLFARELHERLGVPIGILNASWGGTPIEAWTSLSALRQVIDLPSVLAKQQEAASRAEAIGAAAVEQVVKWENEMLPADPGNVGAQKGWADSDFDDKEWASMRVPCPWQTRGLKHNGVVWFRRAIEIPADWVGRELVLTLGAIDDFDTTYFNGRQIGAHPKGTPEAYCIRRRYVVPKELVRTNRAVISVRVFDHFGEGGFMGPASEMRLCLAHDASNSIHLAGEWKYKVEHAIPLVPSSVFQSYPHLDLPLPQYRLSALFNGMLAPLIPFGIRGVIWYQGESNVDQHQRYRDLMIAMVRDWRGRWGLGQFPFLFVQLPNYRGGADWPYMREAQTQALCEPNTAMAVTIDVGDPDDIHPRNKHPVAHRLALHALALCYRQDQQAALGPVLSQVEIVGSRAHVRFANAHGLNAGGAAEVLGFELAGSNGIYHPARATIDADRVIVKSDEVPSPVNVRYAWSDAPAVNLCNATGLPAMPFRTDGY